MLLRTGNHLYFNKMNKLILNQFRKETLIDFSRAEELDYCSAFLNESYVLSASRYGHKWELVFDTENLERESWNFDAESAMDLGERTVVLLKRAK